MTHWCRDVQRDIAVRAAEDGRQGPLPTLEEAIAAITNHDAPPGARVSESPCAGHADTGADTAGTGLRTERVTLEVTHNEFFPVREWSWITMLRLRPGESVRVVEEMPAFAPAPAIAGGTVLVNGQDMVTLGEFLRHTTRLTQEAGVAKAERDEFRRALNVENDHALRITAERDAAIRERDEAKEQAERLRARVAEMDAASVAAGIEITEGDCLSTVRDRGRRPMPKGPPPGLVTPPTTKAASGAASSSAGPKSSTNGWLTEEERKALTLAADQAPESDFVTNAEGKWIKETLTALLARSTPPEVVLPKCEFTRLSTHMMGFLEAIGRVKQALAAAGVKVKEPLPPGEEANG